MIVSLQAQQHKDAKQSRWVPAVRAPLSSSRPCTPYPTTVKIVDNARLRRAVEEMDDMEKAQSRGNGDRIMAHLRSMRPERGRRSFAASRASSCGSSMDHAPSCDPWSSLRPAGSSHSPHPPTHRGPCSGNGEPMLEALDTIAALFTESRFNKLAYACVVLSYYNEVCKSRRASTWIK